MLPSLVGAEALRASRAARTESPESLNSKGTKDIWPNRRDLNRLGGRLLGLRVAPFPKKTLTI